MITLTARGSGYYRVYLQGVQISQHTTEREAAESATNTKRDNPDAAVYYDHDYRVEIDMGIGENAGECVGENTGSSGSVVVETPAESLTFASVMALPTTLSGWDFETEGYGAESDLYYGYAGSDRPTPDTFLNTHINGFPWSGGLNMQDNLNVTVTDSLGDGTPLYPKRSTSQSEFPGGTSLEFDLVYSASQKMTGDFIVPFERFGTPGSYTFTQYGKGGEFWVRYAMRQTFSVIDPLNQLPHPSGVASPKRSLIHGRDSAGSLEETLEDTNQLRLPQMYSNEGTEDYGVQDFAGCPYQGEDPATYAANPACYTYKSDEWEVYHFHVICADNGTLDNGVVEMYVGESETPIIRTTTSDMSGLTITDPKVQNTWEAFGGEQGYGKLTLTLFCSNKALGGTGTDGKVWFDNVVISEERCPKLKATPVVPTSVLGQAANNLSAGEWTEITTINSEALNGTDFIFEFAGKMAWDSTLKQAHFIGSSDPNGSTADQKHVIYDEATNTWIRQPDPPFFGGIQHGYEHTAIDVTGRHLYHKPFGGGSGFYEMNLDTGVWTQKADLALDYVTPASGLTFNPDRGTVQWWNSVESGFTGGQIYEYTYGAGVQGGSWSAYGPLYGAATSDLHSHCQYNPVHQFTWHGGGDGYKDMFELDNSGTRTASTATPAGIDWLGMNGRNNGNGADIAIDPVSGDCLVMAGDYASGGSFWEYEPIGGSWTQLPTPALITQAPNTPADESFFTMAVPVDTHGVTMWVQYIDNGGGANKVLIYKHT